MIIQKVGQQTIIKSNQRLVVPNCTRLHALSFQSQHRIQYDGPSYIISGKTSIIKNRYFSSLGSSSLNTHTYNEYSNNIQHIRNTISLKSNENKNTSKIQIRPKRHSKSNPKTSLGVTTNWVQISGIPPLSTLDELLVDIKRIMQTELSAGIVDLDAAEESLLNQIQEGVQTMKNNHQDDSNPLPLWYPDENDNLSSHLVMEAHLNLSTLYRQAGWFLRFPNRSCVHALLSHIEEATRIEKEYHKYEKSIKKQNHVDEEIVREKQEFSWMDYDVRPLMCGWKEVDVVPFHVYSEFFQSKIDWIDDTVVRVENCAPESTVDDLRYFFSPYDLMDDRNFTTDNNKDEGKTMQREAVQLVVSGGKEQEQQANLIVDGKAPKLLTPSRTNTFLVQFTTAAEARAAVREKQNVELLRKKIKLAQFSRQLIIKR